MPSSQLCAVISTLSVADDSERSDILQITESWRKLEGHSSRVTGLAWSPHVDGLLISVSYDGKALVRPYEFSKSCWGLNMGYRSITYLALLRCQWAVPVKRRLIFSNFKDLKLRISCFFKSSHSSYSQFLFQIMI